MLATISGYYEEEKIKKSIDRFAELLELTNKEFKIQNNCLWTVYNKMVQPYGAVCQDYSLSEHEAKSILRNFKALLIRWNNGFGTNKNKEWYAITCDKFTPMEQLRSKYRNAIKKGLKNCHVERVNAKVIAESGYEVYSAAFQSYKYVTDAILSKNEFYKEHIVHSGFEDIIHYWAVYHENQLIAFVINNIYDYRECNYFTLYLHPKYLNARPSEALFYSMNKYYLEDDSIVNYVNAGFRSLLHDTNIQLFLMKKFNFKRSSTGLSVVYQPFMDIIMNMSYPFREVIKNIKPEFNALYTLEEIRRDNRLIILK